MGFWLSCSNRVESLQQLLCARLQDSPLSDPFQTEFILVPGNAMRRWLGLQIASAHGVAANIDFPLPAAWIWQLAARAHSLDAARTPTDDPLSREQAAWQIFAALPALLPTAGFEELNRYLRDDATGVKRWQLAQRIADVFDRYQYYRPDWIRAWSRSTVDAPPIQAPYPRWQPLLWRALLTRCAGAHRVALLDQLLQVLDAGQPQAIAALQLPARLSCFALSSLPALFVQVFKALSAHIDIHFYQHSPTDQYWADLRSKKSLARQRLAAPLTAAHLETGNELLASWGRQGQAFQDLLLDHELLDAVTWEDYRPPGADSLLHQLQSDMLGLEQGTGTREPDASIQISICHSPLRECQVLLDHLLQRLAADASLKPEDILVIVPEISRYAPAIEAVFRRDTHGSRPFIAWNLSDITVVDEHPLVRVFFALLALPAARFSFSEVLSIVEVPRVASTWGLDSAAQEELNALLRAAQARWGLHAAHKAGLQLPATQQNTWAHALERLLAAYALGDDELWQGIAPQPGATGNRALMLGRFMDLLEVLEFWSRELQRPRSARQWQLDLNRLLDQLFGASDEQEDRVQQIRDEIAELQALAGDQVLGAALLSQCLEERLGTRTVHNRFFSGGVSFCGMRPMRSLPFKLICVLGMNDTAFPRRDAAPAFDAMAAQPRAGDPRKGDEDRYLLLETLLCAREALYLSYTGRSLTDNSDCQPSVLLRELLDCIDAHYKPVGAGNSLMSDCITRLQPLQPFSWRHFHTEQAQCVTAGHDAWWCAVAQALQVAPARGLTRPAWPDAVLEPLPEPLTRVELTQLLRFLEHPVKGFFNARLRVYLQDEEVAEDEEVFTLTGLASWKVGQALVDHWLQGDDAVQSLQQRLAAEGLLPHGSQAALAFAQAQDKMQDLWSRLERWRPVPAQRRHIALTLPVPGAAQDSLQLQALIQNCHPGLGLLHCTSARLKGKYALRLWLEHLALCATDQLPPGEHSVLHCADASLALAPLSAIEARQVLVDCLVLYREGQCRPLPLFPTASFALGSKGLAQAYKAWEGDLFSGDADDAYLQLAMRGCEGSPIELPEHQRLAHSVYGRLLAAQVAS